MFHPKGPTFLEQARQALTSTERGYDLLAPKFEYTPYRTPDTILGEVGGLLEDGEFETALDLCCGTGAGIRMLRPLVKRKIIGLDFSEGMLREAERLLEHDPDGPEVKLVHGDALEMSFEGEFDLVTCFGALGHITEADTSRFLERIHAALKPGGTFAFVTGYSPSPFSLAYWFFHGFNLVMRIRNLLIRPKFIMYYLTFLLPEIRTTLETRGFDVETAPLPGRRNCHLVLATKRAREAPRGGH